MHIIKIEKAFMDNYQDEAIEILTASQIASYMLYPKDIYGRKQYLALAFNKINDVLLKTHPSEVAMNIFYNMICTTFGCWQDYTKTLLQIDLTQFGKGSYPEKAWAGNIAGMVLKYAIQEKASITEACTYIATAILENSSASSFSKPDAENIRKKYWSTYKDVAHFWAAMEHFTLPEPEDNIIRLDKARFVDDLPNENASGWRVLCDMADAFFVLAKEIKPLKAQKPLLDPESALQIVLED